MNLDELRNALEGEAAKKVRDLELKLKKALDDNLYLRKHIDERDMLLEKKDTQLYRLFNVCRALHDRSLCPFCVIQQECNLTVKKYNDVLKIPSREELSKMLLNRCNDIIEKYETEHPEVQTKKEEEPASNEC